MAKLYKLPRSIRKLFTTPFRAIATLILLVVLIVAALELTNVTHLFHKVPQTKAVVTVGTPVSPPKTASSSTQPVAKAPGNNTPRNIGTATDTHGTTSSSASQDQWVTSASGYITVKQPIANSKVQDGSTIVGSAKVATVNYRLKDNKVGVIATGTLSVTNGDFSGTLHFQPQGTGGQLDVFSTDSKGVEYNEVQINVSF